MPHAIRRGAISFGLVHVPVALYPGSSEISIDFDWHDKRTMDSVGYKRVNKNTGKEITKENIVKGVKVESGDYVVPEYTDKFTKAVHALVAKRVEAGDTEKVEAMEDVAPEDSSNVVDLTALLKQSLGKGAGKTSDAKAAPAERIRRRRVGGPQARLNITRDTSMDLSKYDELGAMEPSALKARYTELRERLQDLLSEPVKDMAAVDAVLVELDEVQAGYRDSQKRSEDPQRF